MAAVAEEEMQVVEGGIVEGAGDGAERTAPGFLLLVAVAAGEILELRDEGAETARAWSAPSSSAAASRAARFQPWGVRKKSRSRYEGPAVRSTKGVVRGFEDFLRTPQPSRRYSRTSGDGAGPAAACASSDGRGSCVCSSDASFDAGAGGMYSTQHSRGATRARNNMASPPTAERHGRNANQVAETDQARGSTVGYVTLRCDGCGKTFQRRRKNHYICLRSAAQRGTDQPRFYCSRACYVRHGLPRVWAKHRQRARDNPPSAKA